MARILDTEITTDRNGFAVCRVCGEDNYGEGEIAHLEDCESAEHAERVAEREASRDAYAAWMFERDN